MNPLQYLFDRNRAWADGVKEQDPMFFERLSQQQAPEYLWIGCSDSRVPANQIVSLPPGEVFVHRNIANLVVPTDLNCLSVIQYAADVLQVKHIIVCGHYGCGGIEAAIEDEDHGLIDNWLQHVRAVERLHHDEVEKLDADAKLERLCELNVIEQVRNVCATTTVQRTWRRGRELSVYAWVYDIKNGILKELQKVISNNEDLQASTGR